MDGYRGAIPRRIWWRGGGVKCLKLIGISAKSAQRSYKINSIFSIYICAKDCLKFRPSKTRVQNLSSLYSRAMFNARACCIALVCILNASVKKYWEKKIIEQNICIPHVQHNPSHHQQIVIASELVRGLNTGRFALKLKLFSWTVLQNGPFKAFYLQQIVFRLDSLHTFKLRSNRQI